MKTKKKKEINFDYFVNLPYLQDVKNPKPILNKKTDRKKKILKREKRLRERQRNYRKMYLMANTRERNLNFNQNDYEQNDVLSYFPKERVEQEEEEEEEEEGKLNLEEFFYLTSTNALDENENEFGDSPQKTRKKKKVTPQKKRVIYNRNQKIGTKSAVVHLSIPKTPDSFHKFRRQRKNLKEVNRKVIEYNHRIQEEDEKEEQRKGNRKTKTKTKRTQKSNFRRRRKTQEEEESNEEEEENDDHFGEEEEDDDDDDDTFDSSPPQMRIVYY